MSLTRWPERQLRHISEIPITNGLGESGDSSNPKEWPRYIRTTDIKNLFELHEDRRVTLPEEKATNALVEHADILMTAAGATVGKSVQYVDANPACYAGYLVRWRVNKKVAVPRFMAYWTESLHFWDQIAVGAVKSTIENFSASKYRSMRAPVPSLAEQQAIADYLDGETRRIDELIAEQCGLIEILQERRDAGWASLYELAESAGSMIQVRRVLESIVDGPFGSSLTSAHYSDEGVRVIRLGNIGVNAFRNGDQAFIPPEYAAKLSYHAAQPGDVIIGGLGDEKWPLGRATVLPDVGPAIVKADCYRARPNSLVTADYLAWVLSAPASRRQIALLARGATRARLNTSVVREITIPVPDVEVQLDIVEKGKAEASRIDALITEAEDLIALSQERRAALITAAVTGQIDVRAAA